MSCIGMSSKVGGYYGEGGAMDKRLVKVKAEIEICKASSSIVLIDGHEAYCILLLKLTAYFC